MSFSDIVIQSDKYQYYKTEVELRRKDEAIPRRGTLVFSGRGKDGNPNVCTTTVGLIMERGEVLGQLIGSNETAGNLAKLILIIQLPRVDLENIEYNDKGVVDVHIDSLKEVAPNWTTAYLKARARSKPTPFALITLDYQTEVLIHIRYKTAGTPFPKSINTNGGPLAP